MKTERTILASMVFDTALHIGLGKGNRPTDAPLRRRGDGRLVIPGRSIGGSLRTLTTELAPRLGLTPCKCLERDQSSPRSVEHKTCLCPVCQLFGDLYPDERDPAAGGAEPSRLWISDALSVDLQSQTHVRDGVGLDRRRNAAAQNVKFDFEVIPRNTVFQLRLRLLDDDSEDAVCRSMLLAAVLAEWQAGRAWIGANAARGLGRFHLQNLSCSKTEIQSTNDLINYLQSDDPWRYGHDDSNWLSSARQLALETAKASQEANRELPSSRGFVKVAFTIAVKDVFLVNDPLVALLSGLDHAPMVDVAFSDTLQAGEPVLTGSGLRGALRARAEKIARTLATQKWRTRDDFLIHCPACDPLTKGKGQALHACSTRLQARQAEEIPEQALCLSCQVFGSSHRGSRLKVEDGVWSKGSLNTDSSKVQDFLAIDRFTGGGLDHAKFDAAPLIGAKFRTSLTLESPDDWELGWLVLLLRDLAEGEFSLGFGKAKGYGRVIAEEFIWAIGFLHESDFPGDVNLIAGARDDGIYRFVEHQGGRVNAIPPDWAEQAQRWIDRFVHNVQSFSHVEPEWRFLDDTFFDENGELLQLYGLPCTEIGS